MSHRLQVRTLEHLTVRELRAVAKAGRQLLLTTSPDLTDVAVSLDLSERWVPPAEAQAKGARLEGCDEALGTEGTPAEPPVPTL